MLLGIHSLGEHVCHHRRSKTPLAPKFKSKDAVEFGRASEESRSRLKRLSQLSHGTIFHLFLHLLDPCFPPRPVRLQILRGNIDVRKNLIAFLLLDQLMDPLMNFVGFGHENLKCI